MIEELGPEDMEMLIRFSRAVGECFAAGLLWRLDVGFGLGLPPDTLDVLGVMEVEKPRKRSFVLVKEFETALKDVERFGIVIDCVPVWDTNF